MPETKLNARDTKLVQWLNEAHAKEAELEAELTAHIALTEKRTYKSRLRRHLTETRDHKRKVASRIKQLGGSALTGPSLPGVPDAVGEVAGRAVAAVKTQVGTARAAVTDQLETQLRNVQEELREEHVEIAIYSRIVAFAEEVGDRETAQLAKAIRRDEERMAKFLDAELGRLVKDVVRKQVPRDERPARSTRRGSRRTTKRARAAVTRTSASGTRTSASGTRTSASGTRTSAATRTRSANSSGRSRSTNSASRTRRAGSRRGSTRSRVRSGSQRAA